MQFIYGLIGSFLGGVAFGPINLSVVDVTLNKNLKAAIKFSAAAALVEIFMASIAIAFGKLISRRIEEFPELKLLVIGFFVVLGLIFILKKNKPTADNIPKQNRSSILQGFIVAFLNPQTIPFWIFILAYLKSSNLLYLQSWHLYIFLAGASLGKFTILCLYGYLSDYINRHLNNLSDYVSKGIGGLLLLIGLAQAVKYFFF